MSRHSFHRDRAVHTLLLLSCNSEQTRQNQLPSPLILSLPLPGPSLESGCALCDSAISLQSPLSLTQAMLIKKKLECCRVKVIQQDSHHLGLDVRAAPGVAFSDTGPMAGGLL